MLDGSSPVTGMLRKIQTKYLLSYAFNHATPIMISHHQYLFRTDNGMANARTTLGRSPVIRGVVCKDLMTVP